ncbi:hypothetical protein ABVK25_005548 [Lepraria finkii]|uniref:Cytochrome P450 n=1 Tax=Lepraria finkii TaxID=1340010 RepID=A0ABR4B845_9LECA
MAIVSRKALGSPYLSKFVHMDERFYPKPEEFDPFRFARMRTEGDKPDSTETYDIYLAFSYVRHSCFGRWLVSQTLKLLIAYITFNYDIQPLDKRLPNTIFADTSIPTFCIRIKVRRMRQS